MVADKITTDDIQNLAKGILKVQMPNYKACRSAMSTITYAKDTWAGEDKPNYTSVIDKETNTITITCVK